MDLRQRLAAFMENGIAQQYIADLAGISRHTLSRYISGKTELHGTTKAQVEQALNAIMEQITAAAGEKQ